MEELHSLASPVSAHVPPLEMASASPLRAALLGHQPRGSAAGVGVVGRATVAIAFIGGTMSMLVGALAQHPLAAAASLVAGVALSDLLSGIFHYLLDCGAFVRHLWLYAVLSPLVETFNSVHIVSVDGPSAGGSVGAGGIHKGVVAVASGFSLWAVATAWAMLWMSQGASGSPSTSGGTWWWPAAATVCGTVGFTSLLVFDVHMLAHRRLRSQPVGALVRFCQDAGLLLSPGVHRTHHNGQHAVHNTEDVVCQDWALLSGWCNVVLNPLLGYTRPALDPRAEAKAIEQAHGGSDKGWACVACTLFNPTAPPLESREGEGGDHAGSSAETARVCRVCGTAADTAAAARH